MNSEERERDIERESEREREKTRGNNTTKTVDKSTSHHIYILLKRILFVGELYAFAAAVPTYIIIYYQSF